MIRPDLFVVWPSHIDYPLFRYNLELYREFFREIIIAFTPGLKDRNLEQFVRNSLKNVNFVNSHYLMPDWRQNAMLALLDASNSTHFLSMEQDFMIKPEALKEILSRCRNCDFVGYKEGDRIHPAFSLIKRDVLYLTSKDFSAYPDKGLDHFGLFFKELQDLMKFKNITDFGLEFGRDFYHLAGLTQNYHCFREGQPFYKPDEFLTYNHLVQKLPIAQSQEFMSYSEAIEKAFGKAENETIKRFFPITS